MRALTRLDLGANNLCPKNKVEHRLLKSSGFPRSARQPVLAGGAGYQSHHPVPHENQKNVGRGDCEDRSDPRPVTAPLRKPPHIPKVPRRTDDPRDGYGHG